MKKLFIGCGILVLLIVGALGYVTYQIYPQVKEWQAQWERGFMRLQELEREHPFDAQAQLDAPLDAQRFAASLDLRAALSDDLSNVGEKLEGLGGPDASGKEPGAIELIREMFRTTTPLLANFEARLREAQMSWPEFAFHTRLLWACLLRVDAGVGLPELEPLRGAYDRLKQNYEEQAAQQGAELPKLDDLIGKFPAPLLNEASALLAQDIERVRRGLAVTAVDHFYMQPISRLEDLQGLQAAQEDIARRSAEQQAARDAAGEPGVAAPAGAPEPLGKVPDEELQPPAQPPKQPGDPDKPGDK